MPDPDEFDEPRSFAGDKGDEDSPVSARRRSRADRERDAGLEATFPASDPIPINPGAD